MNKKRVLVALSGGVDSSTSAKLLLDQGYDVIAATFFVTALEENIKGKQTIEKAAKVAKDLGIEHHILDFSKEFEEFVISNFINEYTSGRTPNPCAICNATVKMPLLWEKAKELNCQHLATGHYVRLDKAEDGRKYFYRGVDRGKDQSYFLWKVPAEIVQNLIFPLGSMEKSKVREIAKKLDISSAQSKESQEVCFIDNDDYLDFLSTRLPKNHKGFQPGIILDQSNEKFGTHSGYLSYTIGQRKGLGGGNANRMFVTKIDAETQTISVGENSSLQHTKLTVDNINFHCPEIPLNKPIFVQIRSRHKAVSGIISEILPDNKLKIKLKQPARAVTPGQSGVFYIDDRLIGGGRIISSSL